MPQSPTIAEEQARSLADEFLAGYLPAPAGAAQAVAGEVRQFPGYYTFAPGRVWHFPKTRCSSPT